MGILSSIINAASQQSTNQSNYKIAQMNNKYNYEMFKKQQQYNWDMWNAENEYNTAANQRKRLEEAGLNPYLMMDGGSAGIATSGNPVNPPRAHDVQMQAPQFAFGDPLDSISQVADVQRQMAQNDLLGAQAQQYQIQNQFMAALLGAELEGRNIGNFGKALDVGFLGDTYTTRRQKLETEVRLLELQEQFQDLNNQWKALDVKEKDKYVNTWYDHIQATNLNFLDEQIKSLSKGREVSDAQIKNLQAQAYNAYRDALLKDAQTSKLVKENEAFAKVFDDFCSAQAAKYVFDAAYFGGTVDVEGLGDGISKGALRFASDYETQLGGLYGISNYGHILGPIINAVRAASGRGYLNAF